MIVDAALQRYGGLTPADALIPHINDPRARLGVTVEMAMLAIEEENRVIEQEQKKNNLKAKSYADFKGVVRR